MLFSMLGLILMGFAGFSAAFTLFVFLFGNKGTFINLTKSPTAAPFPFTSFPATGATVVAADILDLTLTTMGMIFLLGGGVATLLLAVLAFLSPMSMLNKCCINKSCLPKDCCPAPAPSCDMKPACNTCGG